MLAPGVASLRAPSASASRGRGKAGPLRLRSMGDWPDSVGAGRRSTIGSMFAAPVWHYWIGVFIFVPVVLMVVGFTVLYLRKTQSPRYGRDD